MNVDRYTKTVLTVIAGALVWLCVNGLPVTAQARQAAAQPTGPMRVIITGVDAPQATAVRWTMPVSLVQTPAANAQSAPLRVAMENERPPRVIVSAEEPLRVTVAGSERPILVEQRAVPVTPR